MLWDCEYIGPSGKAHSLAVRTDRSCSKISEVFATRNGNFRRINASHEMIRRLEDENLAGIAESEAYFHCEEY